MPQVVPFSTAALSLQLGPSAAKSGRSWGRGGGHHAIWSVSTHAQLTLIPKQISSTEQQWLTFWRRGHSARGTPMSTCPSSPCSASSSSLRSAWTSSHISTWSKGTGRRRRGSPQSSTISAKGTVSNLSVFETCARGVWDSSGEDDMPYCKPSYSSCRCVWGSAHVLFIIVPVYKFVLVKGSYVYIRSYGLGVCLYKTPGWSDCNKTMLYKILCCIIMTKNNDKIYYIFLNITQVHALSFWFQSTFYISRHDSLKWLACHKYTDRNSLNSAYE